jgi:polyisoprenoid-binding protein YceI
MVPLVAYGEGTESWNLPQELNDSNTQVRFELDSTWHMVHGKVTNIKGRAELKDAKDPSGVVIHLNFPVGSFDTGNGSRDEEMRDVMAADKFPEVTFKSDNDSLTCTPQQVLQSGTCDDKLDGVLTIRGLSKIVELPVKIKKADTGYEISGALPIRWSEFKIVDPSILVAKVAPLVTVFFNVRLDNQAGLRE